jgi:serine/threonine-protein kinase
VSRRCLKCGSVYEGEARFCPKDGSPLVEAAPAATAAPAAPSSSATMVRKPAAPGPGAAERAASLSNQMLDSRYEVLKKLGEGGMSYVYEAKEIGSTESVAIKVLSPKLGADKTSVERLRREAGLAMRLTHPNCCRILRMGETEDGLIYLVMPYLKGELLSDREVRLGPIAPELGVVWLAEICAGLHQAHQLNIVHRDLKPENIMLVPGPDGYEHAVVMDFGLAKENRSEPGVAKLTATGIILGTPEFMSPEQIRGKALDARSDIYALGIVAFEMFTQKLPFQGRNAQEMMIARLRGQPVPVRQYKPDFPPKLEKALMKSLDANPDNRYTTALEFGIAMAEALGPGYYEKVRDVLQ